jgi:regulatory protein
LSIVSAFPPESSDDFPPDAFDEPDGADERAASPRRAGMGMGAAAGSRGRARTGARANAPARAHEGEGESTRTSDAAAAGTGAARPRRARAKPSLKMQAIGYLSRREYSRQELRRKLLSWLRQRARDEAALAATAQAVAQEQAQALRDWPSNGIDDAFLPPGLRDADDPFAAMDDASGGEWGDLADRRKTGSPSTITDIPAASAATALASLRRADGAPIPAALRQALAALAPEDDPPADRDADGPAPAAEREPERLARLEREDPEDAVDQLLDWLAAQRYLSEARFVESRVNARARKRGTAMIKHELAQHGLVLEPAQAAALRETEFARAQAIWQRKFGVVTTEPRERAKQARFLAARGFASDVVWRIVGGEEQD